MADEYEVLQTFNTSSSEIIVDMVIRRVDINAVITDEVVFVNPIFRIRKRANIIPPPKGDWDPISEAQ